MARKKQKDTSSNDELFIALNLLEKERGIPVDFMLDKIHKAIATACKNNYGNEDVDMEIDLEKGIFRAFLKKTVKLEVENADREINIDKARSINPLAKLDDVIGIPLDTKQFGRVAAQTARNIIRQGIRDSERGQMMKEFQNKHQELVSGVVERVDPRSGALTLRIGKAEAVLPKTEQIMGETVVEGDYIKVYVVDVRETDKGPKAIISRTHPDLVKRMFESEVPEIFDGTIEIKAVSREAGSRTKLAVLSHLSDVDAVGACIGTRGARVAEIVDELGGEKIDIIEYSDDPAKFIAAALSPADVTSVETAEDGQRVCRVVVPDSQLSLAIGNKGQNARLAAKLTGWKIDIKPESEFPGSDMQPGIAEEAGTSAEIAEDTDINAEIIIEETADDAAEENSEFAAAPQTDNEISEIGGLNIGDESTDTENNGTFETNLSDDAENIEAENNGKSEINGCTENSGTEEFEDI